MNFAAALARSAAANVKSEEVSPATATTTATTAQTAVTQGQGVKKAKDNKPEEEEDNNEEDFGGGGWDDMEAGGGNWEEIEVRRFFICLFPSRQDLEIL